MSHRTTSHHTAPKKEFLRWDLGVFALFFGLVQALIWNGRQIPNDWASLWIAGTLVRDGEAEHLYDYDPVDFARISGAEWWEHSRNIGYQDIFPGLVGHPFVQTPGVAYVMSLVTRVISFPLSVNLLTFFSATLLVVMIVAICSLWSRETVPMWLVALISVAASASEPFQFAVSYGQTSVLIYSGIFVAAVTAPRWPLFSGFTLGIVAAIKLTPLALIVVFALFPQRRKAAVAAAVTAVAALGASFAVAGPAVWNVWTQNLSRIADVALVAPPNISLASIMLADTHSGKGVITVYDPPMELRLIPLIFCAVIALLTLAAALWLHHLGRDWAFALVISQAVVLSSIYSTIVWSHYFICVLALIIGIAVMRVPEWIRCAVPVGVAMYYYRPFAGFELVAWRPGMLVGAVILSVTLLLCYVWTGLQTRQRPASAVSEQ